MPSRSSLNFHLHPFPSSKNLRGFWAFAPKSLYAVDFFKNLQGPFCSTRNHLPSPGTNNFYLHQTAAFREAKRAYLEKHRMWPSFRFQKNSSFNSVNIFPHFYLLARKHTIIHINVQTYPYTHTHAHTHAQKYTHMCNICAHTRASVQNWKLYLTNISLISPNRRMSSP